MMPGKEKNRSLNVRDETYQFKHLLTEDADVTTGGVDLQRHYFQVFGSICE